MKTQLVNIGQTFFNISNLMLTGLRSFNINKLFPASKFSISTMGQYLLPLIKQLLRDSFMGSDMEIGMLLIFLKSYFLSAVEIASNNAVTDLIKKFRGNKSTIAILNTERIYDHQQAA